jgi:transposase InsO family protein
MDIKLHANATTTPRVRAYIRSSSASVAQLARDLGVSETTVRRWRQRSDYRDRSHARHRLGQSTSLEEEAVICALRRDARLGLDDLVEVMHRCLNPSLSRSAVYRCLKRHGLSRLPDESEPPARPGLFEATPFGFVHVDLKHLTRLEGRPAYVFVAIERTTRFAWVEILPDKRQATVAAVFRRFLKAFGHPVHTVLTDNGSEFTDRFAVDKPGKPEGRPSGQHAFDQACRDHDITHRLTRPFRPQTNGLVERFNRRLSEALRTHPPSQRNRGKNRFETQAERNNFIRETVDNYNRTRLKCLGYNAPAECLNNLTELNTTAGISCHTGCTHCLRSRLSPG